MARVVLVTGASRGIGAATARLAAERGGDPIEVARTILWLASDEASYVTGAIVDCSGGR